jgi:hypothetical protein
MIFRNYTSLTNHKFPHTYLWLHYIYKIFNFTFNSIIPHSPLLPIVQQLWVGQGFLIIEASQSYCNTPHLVGLLWISDQSDAETSIWQHNTHMRQTYVLPAGFRPTIPVSKRLQTHALDHAVIGIGFIMFFCMKFPKRHRATLSHFTLNILFLM